MRCKDQTRRNRCLFGVFTGDNIIIVYWCRGSSKLLVGFCVTRRATLGSRLRVRSVDRKAEDTEPQSANCRVPKCQVPSAKCQVPSAKCQVPSFCAELFRYPKTTFNLK